MCIRDRINILEQHVEAEMKGDLELTMSTMIDNPHLLNIPNMVGGDGFDDVKTFY